MQPAAVATYRRHLPIRLRARRDRSGPVPPRLPDGTGGAGIETSRPAISHRVGWMLREQLSLLRDGCQSANQRRLRRLLAQGFQMGQVVLHQSIEMSTFASPPRYIACATAQLEPKKREEVNRFWTLADTKELEPGLVKTALLRTDRCSLGTADYRGFFWSMRRMGLHNTGGFSLKRRSLVVDIRAVGHFPSLAAPTWRRLNGLKEPGHPTDASRGHWV